MTFFTISLTCDEIQVKKLSSELPSLDCINIYVLVQDPHHAAILFQMFIFYEFD